MQRAPRLVSDVMTGRVVAVSHDATFKDIVKTIRQWKVSGLPVVEGEQKKVVGVVSEADLLRKEEFRDRDPGPSPRLQGLSGLAKADAVTAQELMTAPAVTVRATATLAQAARIMAQAGVKRLPVVGDEGALLGIVSRTDLLTVFMRDDEDIAEEVRDEIIARLFPELREPIQVEVHDGVVKLTGRVPDTTLVPITTRLVRGVEGVVDVDCALVGLPRRPDLDPDLPQATRRPWGTGTIT